MKNREWLNQLTNKQLIKFMKTFQENPCCACANYFLYNGKEEDSDEDCDFCYEGQVKWLEMEHNDKFFEERDFRYCV